MSESSSPSKTPWHLWVVGGVSLLWNAMGLLDFAMTMSRNDAYMSHFTEAQLEYFYGFPMWVNIAWAIAVVGSVIGSLLLLLKKGLAFPIFGISFVAMLATTIHNFVLAEGFEIMGGAGAAVFSAAIFIIALLLFLYARALVKKGVLK